jgi:hypothetical protein
MPADTMDVAHVIQLAIAPVFLLSSLGTFMAVLSTRLGRIVDRSRLLVTRLETTEDDVRRTALRAELTLGHHRRRIVNFAITAATVAALLICVLIAAAFVGSLLGWAINSVVAVLFVLAMGAYISSLLSFLREVLLASRAAELDRH